MDRPTDTPSPEDALAGLAKKKAEKKSSGKMLFLRKASDESKKRNPGGGSVWGSAWEAR